MSADPFAKLQAWYKDRCNGEWEHQYGINIETIDNPGWLVTIDLVATPWEDLDVERVSTISSETSWFHYQIMDGQFIGSGGAKNLPDVIEGFFSCLT